MKPKSYGLLDFSNGTAKAYKPKPETLEQSRSQLMRSMLLLTELLKVLRADTRFGFYTATNLIRFSTISLRYKKLTGITKIRQLLAQRLTRVRDEDIKACQEMVIESLVTVHTLLNNQDINQKRT